LIFYQSAKELKQHRKQDWRHRLPLHLLSPAKIANNSHTFTIQNKNFCNPFLDVSKNKFSEFEDQIQ